LGDRVYVFDIETEPVHRRKGYAMAFLLHLAQSPGQSITPVQELLSASGFWDAARDMKDAGLVVTQPLSVGDMADEAGRWRHLQPRIERLQQQIDARLNVHCEPWHVAVGRGLE
jgi:hypothetical protein